jgi:hypothetical protein
MKPAGGKVRDIGNSMVINGKSVHVPGPCMNFPELAASIGQKYFEILRAGLRCLSMPQKWKEMVTGDFLVVDEGKPNLPPELHFTTLFTIVISETTRKTGDGET